jgi:hypothetical protein
MGCRGLFLGPHEQGIGIIGTIGDRARWPLWSLCPGLPPKPRCPEVELANGRH